jgi:hypothetical protein
LPAITEQPVELIPETTESRALGWGEDKK